jgi:N-acetylneuraminic acid mutarotase
VSERAVLCCVPGAWRVLALGVALGAAGGCRPATSAAPDATAGWQWRQTAAFAGAPLWFSAAFTVGTGAYVGTGYDLTTAFWRYDPDSDMWARRADFGGAPRGAAVAFAIGTRGYLGLGFGSPEVRFADLWEYDPDADRWTQKAPLPGAPRDHVAAFVIGQRAYVVGGMTCDGSACAALKEVWAYDPQADAWTRKADLPEETTAAACFVLNGIGYVATGMAGPLSAAAPSANLWAYDPQSDTWARKADLPGPARYRAVGFSLGGTGYIATGMAAVTATSAVVFRDVWEYDSRTDAWTRRGDLRGAARGAAVSFTLGSRVYIGTGVGADLGLLSDFWSGAPVAPASEEGK